MANQFSTKILLLSGLSVTAQNIILSSQTGAFYAVTNPSQFISTGAGDTRYALASNTGSFVTTSQTGSFVATSQTGSFITTSQTGAFYAATNPAGYITSSQVGGINSINITGLTISGAITLTGDGGVLLYTGANQTIYISGTAGGGVSQSYVDGEFFNNAQKGITLSNFDGIPTGRYLMPIWRVNSSIVVTGVQSYLVGVSGAIVNAKLNTNSLLSVDMNIITTGTWYSSGIIINSTGNPGDTLWADVVNITGFPTSLTVQIDYIRT